MFRILVSSILMLALHACSEAPAEISTAADTAEVQAFIADSAAIERGAAIFAGSCASYCHATEPEEGLDASFLFDCEWDHGTSDQEIFDVVTKGVPGTRMVGFGSNFPQGDDDLWKVIAYLRSQQQAC